MLNSLLKQRASQLLQCLWPEDISVVDRGFRDPLSTLEKFELIAKIPHFLEHGSQDYTNDRKRISTCYEDSVCG